MSKFRPLQVQALGPRVFSISCSALGFEEQFTFRVNRRVPGTGPQTKVSLIPEEPTREKKARRTGAPKKKSAAPARAKKSAPIKRARS